ncbi:CCKAR protein, partial [Polyodon spathula]|nr:CCKAR protein [Polyodon spathula]
MVALFCMPFTLIPNLLGDFIFGEAMCKIVAYFMGISVSVSTFSLVAIAIERYSAICNPLKSRAWQTRCHAYRVIASTWILSLIVMIPYPVFSTLMAFPKANNSTGHNCRLMWPNDQVQQAWYLMLLITLFFIPGIVMIIAYGLISRELYRGIQFELDQKKEISGQGKHHKDNRLKFAKRHLNNGYEFWSKVFGVMKQKSRYLVRLIVVTFGESLEHGVAHKNGLNVMGNPANSSDEGDGCYIQVTKCQNTVEMSTLNPSGGTKMDRARSNTSEAKLLAKKRVIRMLIVIVAMFFVCWMPIYSVNTWRAFDHHTAHKVLSGAPISFIHLMSYTSACVNPIIYCFMNKRFRKTFLATFACCWRPCCRFQATKDDVAGTGASLSKFSYATVSTLGPS